MDSSLAEQFWYQMYSFIEQSDRISLKLTSFYSWKGPSWPTFESIICRGMLPLADKILPREFYSLSIEKIYYKQTENDSNLKKKVNEPGAPSINRTIFEYI